MKLTGAIIVLLLAELGSPGAAIGQQPAPAERPDELTTARQLGWIAAFQVVESLKANKQSEFPGINAWLLDFETQTKGLDPLQPPTEWPKIGTDALAKCNPKFWRAFYEIAPGDPGAAILYAGLLLGGGESVRALNIIEMQQFRPGIPQPIQLKLGQLYAGAKSAYLAAEPAMKQGIALHDQGDYEGAIAKYREALAIWPQSPIAHYEIAHTMRTQQFIAVGERPENPGVDARVKHSPEILALLAQARRYSPFMIEGYIAEVPDIRQQGEAILYKIAPAMRYMGERPNDPDLGAALQVYAEGCQDANVHDFALFIRQIVVARRGQFEPADHPFIGNNLRELAPGPDNEATLERLARKSNAFYPIVPIAGQASPPEPEWMFTLGTPHFIKNQNAENVFAIVVPVQVQKQEQFELPGLRPAIAVLDEPLKAPMADLKFDEGLSTVNFDENGKPKLVRPMTSRQQNTTMEVHMLKPPRHESSGLQGVVRIGFRGLPEKEAVLFLCDDDGQASRAFVFHKKNFVVGDSDATFQAMVAKLPVDEQGE